jgi:aminoglycoside/choline kinase family phosphotransferase
MYNSCTLNGVRVTERLNRLKDWLQDTAGLDDFVIEPASEDASFRRYFRIAHNGRTLIAMDAPPGQEDLRPFVHVSRLLDEAGVHVPELYRVDLELGFILLSDLGSQLYLDTLSEENADRLYGDALGALIAIQACGACDSLPPYDRTLLMNEMALFRDWLVGTHLSLVLSDREHDELEAAFTLLADSALDQPRVFVHRDYHSRNLMVTAHNNPGIIDYQDAVAGPVTYDLVSLLRDCYVEWPRTRVEDWALGYLELASQSGVLQPNHGDEAQFLRWFDWMGVQRHLKASGIFARLYRRDGKPGYLADIPRTLNYVLDVGDRYPELAALRAITSKVFDRFATARITGTA